MTDGDPFGRRGGRKSDDRDYSSPWNDEGAIEDPYDYPPARAPRRPASNQPPSGRDPYGSQGQPSYGQDPNRYPPPQDDWEAQQRDAPAWPDRPYANPPSQRTERQYDPYAQPPPYEYDEQEPIDDLAGWQEEPRDGRRLPRAARGGEGRAPRAPRAPLPRPTMPPAISAAIAGQDSRLLIVAAGSALSLAAMAAITATRVDALPGWFPLHIDASGVATEWGSPSALWRLPFSLAMLTLMNVLAAFLLGLRDHRVSWILIGSLPLIHIIAWIALILIGW